jgi:hypothetical protein
MFIVTIYSIKINLTLDNGTFTNIHNPNPGDIECFEFVLYFLSPIVTKLPRNLQWKHETL